MGTSGINMTNLNRNDNLLVTSLETTNTLKGIAILTVLMNHYLNFNLLGDYAGFANLWVSIFFILSGYGIYRSIERKFIQGLTFRGLLAFYYHRLVRIFPLLWLALFLSSLLGVFKVSIWMVLGIHGEGSLWFIPALVQCYLISIFIFYGLKKNSKMFMIVLTMTICLFDIFFIYRAMPEYITELLIFTNSNYRGVFFLNILLFSFGMHLSHYFFLKPTLSSRIKSNKASILFYLFTLIIFISIAIGKYFLSTSLQFFFQILPLIMIGLLCFYSLRNRIKNSFLAHLGSISYSIYLFHEIFYFVIAKLNQFHKNSLTVLIWTVLLFPVFIFLCTKLEEAVSFLGGRLASQIKKSEQ